MNKEQLQLILRKYLPPGAEEYAADILIRHAIQLRITKPRTTKYGDYRPPTPGEPHRISLNNDLNPYAFLVTFLHEAAHLTNFEKHRTRVAPHGPEWKEEFKMVSTPIFHLQMLPTDIDRALKRYLSNPAASSCTDANLFKTLRKYDADDSWLTLDEIPFHRPFEIQDGRKFVKNEKLRSRFKCTEIPSGKTYFVHGITLCKPIPT